ncbi:T9SS type A sorting domain-containing protein [Aequorivita todarodis]|uniref:T9SS type A sorting domain-containing protein n=1 Tax=Aequorivita todarodis TaxID=2036821 RepID=UPI002350FDB0|nr:T9SS type A sorting domain-containing protein [Aequorivita todarodis]MDC8000673.1 T9SS type A sorting domain-containing protein [Aequorivita todarodis]
MKPLHKTCIIAFALITTIVQSFGQAPGTFNTTFGNGGILSRPVRYSNFVTEDVALQDNFLLVSGRLNANYGNENIVLRYDDNGAIDRSFANNGVLSFPFETGTGYSTINTFPNHDILVHNLVNSTPQEFYPRFSRYNANGVLITSFGNNGYFNLDYLQQDLRIPTNPTIDPNTGDFEIPLNVVTPNPNDLSFLVKVKNDGTVDTGFGNNGQTDNFLGHIASMDRNPFTSSFFEDIFGGAQGDLILGITYPYAGYYQYVNDSGTFIDNSADDRDALFVGRFYERVFIQLNTNLMLFDGHNIMTFPLDDPNNVYSFTNFYRTANPSQKPGFKKINDNEFLLFGDYYSNFLISKTVNGGFGLNTSFGNNGNVEVEISPNNEPNDDRLIDCFQKPNGKFICAGYSVVSGLDGNNYEKLSMIQLFDNGNFDTSFGSNGVNLFDNGYITGSGQILNTNIENPYIPYKPWIGTVKEPFTQKTSVYMVNPLFVHQNGSNIGRLDTEYLELELADTGKYFDLTETNQFSDEVVLGVGFVKNNDNNFAMVRFKEANSNDFFYNNFYGSNTDQILQTDINNGSDDKATSFVIQNDNGIQKILVVGESNGNLAMARYFADGADAGILDASFGNGGIIFAPRPLTTTAEFIPNKSINGDNSQFYICGEETEGTTKRFMLKKFDVNGEVDETFLAYDEMENANENKATDVLKTSDGGFIVIGKTFNNGEHILKIRKYDSSGNAVPSFGNNSYIFLNTNDEVSELTDLIELTNGGIAVVGYSEDELLVMVFNGITGAMDIPFANNGILRGTFGYDSIHLTSVTQEDATNILISGTSELDGKKNVFNAKVYISEFLGVVASSIETQIIIYPNPATDIVMIEHPLNISINEVRIYDQTGKLLSIKSENVDSISTESLANGLYFIEIYSAKEKITKKVLIQK